MTLLLEGLLVVDVSQGVPGALCAMTLGDFGARVVKVEPPGGDWLRTIGPFVGGESSVFLQLNRNKRGLCLDLKSDEGREVFRRLAASADVLIEGYRPGVMDRLGHGYAALAAINPRLIYCSISGYGSRGPLADQPAGELDMQAFTGKNRQLGVAGDPPLRVGFDIVSTNAAWAAAQAILAALFWRERTGEGQRVETSLLDAAVAIMQWTTGAESNPDAWQGRPLMGYTEPPDHGYQSRDRPFLMDLGRGEDEWRRFCQVLDLGWLAEDPRFKTYRDRARNEAELKDLLNPVLAQWDYEELRALVQNAFGGTIVPMHDLASLAVEPQMASLDILQVFDHPVAGRQRTLDIPWDFSEEVGRFAPVPAPRLGQHDGEILAELGYAPGEIDALRRECVIRPAATPDTG